MDVRTFEKQSVRQPQGTIVLCPKPHVECPSFTLWWVSLPLGSPLGTQPDAPPTQPHLQASPWLGHSLPFFLWWQEVHGQK